MDVSVIIVNWNTRDILHNCLSSVFNQPEGIKFEVIVVDNGSTDGSVEMIRAEFPQVILLANNANRGFAAANNQGFRIARGEYVLLLNSDTLLFSGSIAKTITFANAHPQAAVVGCRVLNQNMSLQPTCFMFPSLLNMLFASTYLYKIFPRSRLWGRERMTWWDRNDARKVDVVTGCFMLVQKSAIDQVGGMDERFFMYGEETDWCYRFKLAGWEVMFTPCAQIIHLGKASSAQVKHEMRLQLSGSILLYFKKHKGWVQYAIASFFTAIFFLIRIPYWVGMAIISKKNRSTALSTVRTYTAGFFLSFAGCKYLCDKGTFCSA
jgi:GT2 family glycosyltransferase